MRFSSMFIKNAKNSNNKIKVIIASATTSRTTKNKTVKSNKANIQPNKIQIKIADCLFFVLFCKSRKEKGIANYTNHER